MKIAIDARELRTTTGRYIERLLHYLQIIDHDNDYVVLLKPKDMAGWTPTNPRFEAVPCPHKEFTFDEQLGLLRQLQQLQPDLVHFPMVQQPVLYSGTVVTTMNDLTSTRFRNPAKNAVVLWLKQYVYRWVNRRVAKKSAALITYTDYVKHDVIEFTGVSPDKFRVISLAADSITEAPIPVTVLEGKQFIMYVGRPLPHKNLGRLIDAFALLKDQHPDLSLVLAGKRDANYTRYEKTIKDRGVTNVVFTDFVADAQLRWLYEHCSAYVFPSLSEGFGLPGLEAMRHGAPVVSSNATCLPEVYGGAAHYFDPLDVTDMARAINDVLTDTELRNNLVKSGLTQVDTYSWERMAKQTLAVYNEVLSK